MKSLTSLSRTMLWFVFGDLNLSDGYNKIKQSWASGELVHQLRIGSGLVLFTFVTTHLLNHALGLVSIDVMEVVREYRVAITRSTLGTIIIMGSGLVHMVLGVSKFLGRRTWKMRFNEIVQLGFGLLIPLVLLRHMIATRGAYEAFGIDDNYVTILFVMWPGEAVNQVLLIALVWVHSCIGLYIWLRMKPWFSKVLPYALGLAILIPVLGFSGFSVGGRIVGTIYEFKNPYTPEYYATLMQWINWAFWGYAAILGSFLAFRVGRTIWDRFGQSITIDYSNGPTIKTAKGHTLLETSKAFDVPHSSVCGGKARCSTCRVRVLSGLENQPLASETEQKVLDRIGAMGNVRLACQLRPMADLSVVPLLPAKRTKAKDAHNIDKYFWGVEQEITMLFADLRGFTKMSEDQLPYDVVFMLNQYLGNMSEVIEDAGGYVDKFMGDGIMAIFGMDQSSQSGAKAALKAAKAMSGVLDSLNMSMADELPERLRIGIGLHTGPAILGRIGVASESGAGERITALGDTVNAASRLESASKELAAELVVSKQTLEMAGYELPPEREKSIMVKGKANALTVYTWSKATKLEI